MVKRHDTSIYSTTLTGQDYICFNYYCVSIQSFSHDYKIVHSLSFFFSFHSFIGIVGSMLSQRIFGRYGAGWPIFATSYRKIAFNGILCDILTTFNEFDAIFGYFPYCINVPIQLGKTGKLICFLKRKKRTIINSYLKINYLIMFYFQ